MVAFPWLVLTTTHSALSTGVVLAMFTLPYVLFGAVAGGVLDRIDRRGVMVAADIVRCGLVLAVPFVAQHSTGGVFVLAFLTSCATVFFDPGLMALLPDIVTGDDLLRANSVLAASTHVTEIVGYAVAGFVVLLPRMRTVFTVDAATFGVSAVTLLAMTLRPSAARQPTPRRIRRSGRKARLLDRDSRGHLLPGQPCRAARQHPRSRSRRWPAWAPSTRSRSCSPPSDSAAPARLVSWRPLSPSATLADRSPSALSGSACARASRSPSA